MNSFLKYIGLRKREELKKLCSKHFNPPPFLLKKVFELENLDLDDEKEIEKYRKMYKKNCSELINKFLDKKFIKKVKNYMYTDDSGNIKYKQISEILLNSLLKNLESKAVDKNPFFTSEGKTVINMMFDSHNKTNQIYGWAMAFTFMVAIFISSDYMDKTFITNILEIMPVEILRQKWLIKILLTKSSAILILESIKKYIKQKYNVPENFFNGIIERHD